MYYVGGPQQSTCKGDSNTLTTYSDNDIICLTGGFTIISQHTANTPIGCLQCDYDLYIMWLKFK